MFNLLIIVGSFSKKSYNLSLAKAAKTLAPEDFKVEIFIPKDLPFYSADLEADGFPKEVEEFREKISSADALLIVTPEYNNFIPGVLKNALDWASRKGGEKSSVVESKPVAIAGATDGGFGTVRAQLHLLALLSVLNMKVLTKTRLPVSKAQDKFDKQGLLVDPHLAEKIETLLQEIKTFSQL